MAQGQPQVLSFDEFVNGLDATLLTDRPVNLEDVDDLLRRAQYSQYSREQRDAIRARFRRLLARDEPVSLDPSARFTLGWMLPLDFLKLKVIGEMGKVGTRQDIAFLRNVKFTGISAPSGTQAEAIARIEERTRGSGGGSGLRR